MKEGNFIWADLSTYDTQRSMSFYQHIFNWSFESNSGYFLAGTGGDSIAGIYETPPFFQKIKMPHFWMSYFQVDSIDESVKLAEKLNGKVEISSADFFGGKIALIRDPQGAGFTIYEGEGLYLNPQMQHGTISKTELHVSNASKVLSFYSTLFGWDISRNATTDYFVMNRNKSNEIRIREIDNNTKGKFEYWTITFYVDNLVLSTEQILNQGGSVVYHEGNRTLITDNTKEAFFYIEQRRDNIN